MNPPAQSIQIRHMGLLEADVAEVEDIISKFQPGISVYWLGRSFAAVSRGGTRRAASESCFSKPSICQWFSRSFTPRKKSLEPELPHNKTINSPREKESSISGFLSCVKLIFPPTQRILQAFWNWKTQALHYFKALIWWIWFTFCEKI